MNRDTKATVLPALTIDLLKEEGFLAENAFTELWRRFGVKTILNELLSNLVYRESSGGLFLISCLLNAVYKFNAIDDIC